LLISLLFPNEETYHFFQCSLQPELYNGEVGLQSLNNNAKWLADFQRAGLGCKDFSDMQF